MPTHFLFLPLRFHLQTVSLITDFVVGKFIVYIRIRTHTIGWMFATRRATRPQIRCPFPPRRCLDPYLESGVARLPDLRLEHSPRCAPRRAFPYTVLTNP